MARLFLGRHARADLAALQWHLADAVEEALDLLKLEPDLGHALRGRFFGLRALKVGAYRVLYELRDGDRTVRVLAIRHRSVAYSTDPR